MKITLSSLSIIAFCLAQQANAQDYDLNKYKYRFQQYRALYGGFEMKSDGGIDYQKYKDNDTIPENQNIN